MTLRNNTHERELERRLTEAAATIGLSNAQEALRASEQRYRAIVETCNEGVWQTGADHKTVFMNRRMAKMLGCEADMGAGRSPAEFLDEPSRTAYASHVRDPVATQVEVGFVRPDGGRVCALLEATPMFDPAGHYTGTLAMVMDITERKRTKAALGASQARFRRLWDSKIIMISVWDNEGRIIEMNDAGMRLVGYTRDELISQKLSCGDLTAPESRDVDAAAFAELAATGIASPWEKELLRKNGQRVPILAAAAMLDNSESIGVAIDLSGRKRVEADLRGRMQVAALSATIATVMTHVGTLEEILTRCAVALADHLGVVARIWLADTTRGVLTLEATGGASSTDDLRIPIGDGMIGRIAETRQSFRTEVLGGTQPPFFAGHPLVVDDELLGVIAVSSRDPLTDATFVGLAVIADTIAVGVQRNRVTRANVQLEEQLRQSQKMEAVGRLAGGIAHDFNNILSVILSCGEFILEDLPPGDPIRADATAIREAAMRAAALTRQLLMFSRQQVLAPKVLDLADVLEHMTKMLQRILGEDVDLVIRADRGVGRVCLDPGSIDQVIMNLVVNARDAMPTGGNLTIETANVELDDDFVQRHPGSTIGPHVLLSIADTGTGIDAVTLAHVFEPFFTTKPVGTGTGLGLSTVFGIVQQSLGYIRVTSEVGVGTSFRIYLPRVNTDAEPLQDLPPLESVRGKEMILLVEDEEQVRVVAGGILRRAYRVVDFRSPGEALLYCENESQPIQLLLTDVVMPQMSGRELGRRLLLTRPEMKVLWMSGYTDDSVVRHGVLRDEVSFLQKPFTPETLTTKVRRVLDLKRST